MQETRVELVQRVAFDLHAGEEALVAAETEAFGDTATRTIGADQEARVQAEIRQGDAASLRAEERKLADRSRLKEQQREQLTGNSRAAKQIEALAKEIGDWLSEYQSLQARIRASRPR